MDRLLTTAQVLALLQVSRATLYRYIDSGTFLRPRKLGPRRCAWRESEVLAWLQALPNRGEA